VAITESASVSDISLALAKRPVRFLMRPAASLSAPLILLSGIFSPCMTLASGESVGMSVGSVRGGRWVGADGCRPR
jgi:hypothetical protein